MNSQWHRGTEPGIPEQRTFVPPGVGHSSGGPPEWCLHAQLTISHPKSEPIRTSYVATGMGGGEPKANWTTTGSNVQFQYSWSNCDKETVTQVIPESGIQKFESWPRGRSLQKGNCVDSGYTTNGKVGEPKKARNIQPYRRRCISTCTITLTNEGTNSQQPTGKFSFSTENLDNLHCSSNLAPVATTSPPIMPSRILVKDAETQTSPTKCVNELTSIIVNPDTSNLAVLNNNKAMTIPQKQLHQKQETHGKDSFRSVPARGHSPVKPVLDHSHCSRGSLRNTSMRRAKSSPPIRYQQKSNQPRTVHIDVYCTGSEMSTSTEDNENESSAGTSSTPQTVYNTSQYKIHHLHHKTGLPQHYRNNIPGGEDHDKEEPEKHLSNKDKEKNPTCSKSVGVNPSPNSNLEKPEILNNCSSISNPSLLGPQSTLKVHETDFVTLRKNLSRESCSTRSTSALSTTTYPSSVDRLSRVSTASSFSFASGIGVNANNNAGPWRDPRSPTAVKNVAASQNNEKGETKLDQYPTDFDQILFDEGMENNDQWWLQYLFSKFETKDEETLENNKTSPRTVPNKNLSRGHQERDLDWDNSNLLKMKRFSVPSFNLCEEEKAHPPFMELSSVTQLQSRLDAAAKFGDVVRSLKKPGHHIPGPTKNPSCPCDHCRLYFENKEKGKDRPVEDEETEYRKVFSLGRRKFSRGEDTDADDGMDDDLI